MKHTPAHHTPVVALLVVGLGALACSEDPAGPATDDDIPQALIEEANGAGLGTAAGQELPQGAAPFTGPGGMPMQATAEEFIQQVTRQDGVVMRTSGISVHAVPASPSAGQAFDRLGFGAAVTGSLESVDPGEYELAPIPGIDFVTRIPVNHASVRQAGMPHRTYAEEGRLRITSIDYFDDLYTCELNIQAIAVERCDYQLGVLSGVIEFGVTLDDGTDVVQQSTTFTVPIRRRTIVGAFR